MSKLDEFLNSPFDGLKTNLDRLRELKRKNGDLFELTNRLTPRELLDMVAITQYCLGIMFALGVDRRQELIDLLDQNIITRIG